MIFFTLFPWICAIFGLIVGSFLNVIILRTEQSETLGGRSHCNKCQKTLRWYELIPIVSFLIQRGRCRSCNTQISIQYLLVEVLTAILFTIAGQYALMLFWSPFSIVFFIGLGLLFIIFSLIIILSIYDVRTKRVPVRWLMYLVVTSILYLVVYYIDSDIFLLGSFIPHMLGILVGVPFLVIYLLSSGRLIGFADIEIITWMGMMLGVAAGWDAVILAFYLGAIFAIGFVGYHIIIKKESYKTIRKKTIAFVPFLFLGWLVTTLTQFSIIELFTSLFL